MKVISRNYDNGFPNIGIEIVVLNGDNETVIKRFNEVSDDYAYTNAANYLKEYQKTIKSGCDQDE